MSGVRFFTRACFAGLTCVHRQVFDFVVAEHLFLNCMIAEGTDVRGTTMSGFRCLESYLIYVNSEARLLTRIADTEFTVAGNPFDIRVRGCM